MPTGSSSGAITVRAGRFGPYVAWGKVYATLMALWTARSTFTLVLKADAGATATTNPQFTVTVFIANMPVISGTRGDRHMTNVTFQPASALAIATS